MAPVNPKPLGLLPYNLSQHERSEAATATLVAIGPDWKAKDLPQRIKAALSQGR